MTTLWASIADAARRASDRPLLADEHGRSLTARRLHDAACSTAAALAGRGVGPGTVVSWQRPTTLETMVVMAALARLSAVQNPIVPMLREREVGFITGQAGTQVLVVKEVWHGFQHGEMARGLARERGFDVVTVDLSAPPAPGELRLPGPAPRRCSCRRKPPRTPAGFTTRRKPLRLPRGFGTPTPR